ncbi:MAG: exonuclease domain-containing protein [Myxococcales bacterium]|nr:exonuclease domain-containing protein [Myxococcales bacterium]
MNHDFDRVVVLDFEATCQRAGVPQPQEIIEFPSVLISLDEGRVLDEFSSFVRPIHHPELSEFCTELTSIVQADVDGAPTFPEVLAAHRAWLEGHGLLHPEAGAALITCGDWDLQTALPVQCAASGPPITALPPIYRRWINIKKIFAKVKPRAKGFGMPSMLRGLGMELRGRHHRGIDDCHNIARIALGLAALGGRFEITGRLSSSHYPEIEIEVVWGEARQRTLLRKRHLATVLGLASGLFKTKMVKVFAADGGEIVDDEPLMELAAGSALRVVSQRELA